MLAEWLTTSPAPALVRQLDLAKAEVQEATAAFKGVNDNTSVRL